MGNLPRRIAIIAKYSFYFDDVCKILSDLNIEVVSAGEISEIQEKIENGIKFDFIFFPHYSQLVPSYFLLENDCIGFHTGNLPSDRGGSPIQNKILKGEYSTRVSALRLVDEVDAGDTLCQEDISLEHGNIEEILGMISNAIARLVRVVMTQVLIPVPQVGEISISRRLNPQDSQLEIDNLEIKQIYDRIRMLDGLDYPPAYIQFSRYRVYLSKAEYRESQLTFVARLEENN